MPLNQLKTDASSKKIDALKDETTRAAGDKGRLRQAMIGVGGVLLVRYAGDYEPKKAAFYKLTGWNSGLEDLGGSVDRRAVRRLRDIVPGVSIGAFEVATLGPLGKLLPKEKGETEVKAAATVKHGFLAEQFLALGKMPAQMECMQPPEDDGGQSRSDDKRNGGQEDELRIHHRTQAIHSAVDKVNNADVAFVELPKDDARSDRELARMLVTVGVYETSEAVKGERFEAKWLSEDEDVEKWAMKAVGVASAENFRTLLPVAGCRTLYRGLTDNATFTVTRQANIGTNLIRVTQELGSVCGMRETTVDDISSKTKVYKIGRATGLTSGVIELIDVDILGFRYSANGMPVRFTNLFAVAAGKGSFADQADSGASVFAFNQGKITLLGIVLGGVEVEDGRRLTLVQGLPQICRDLSFAPYMIN